MMLGGAVAVIALAISAVAWARMAPHYHFKVRSLSLGPSGLYDQAGAELPFVTLRMSVPELDGWDLEFSQDPFDVECKVRDRWVKIDNHASIRSMQSEMWFLILPGTEMSRLHFKYQREGMKWRLLRALVPSGVPYHQFPNRFWQWLWLKTPLGPKLITLMYHRNHFRRPPHWEDMTAEIAIPSGLVLREQTHASD